MADWPSDIEKVTDAELSPNTVRASRILADMIGFRHDDRHLRLEQKVTLAVSLLLSLVNLSSSSASERADIVASSIQKCDPISPLVPFLGDEEWRDVGPPDTEYLATLESKEAYEQLIEAIVGTVVDTIPALSPSEAACALLFHIDHSFRNGIFSMIRPHLVSMTSTAEYIRRCMSANPGDWQRGNGVFLMASLPIQGCLS